MGNAIPHRIARPDSLCDAIPDAVGVGPVRRDASFVLYGSRITVVSPITPAIPL